MCRLRSNLFLSFQHQLCKAWFQRELQRGGRHEASRKIGQLWLKMKTDTRFMTQLEQDDKLSNSDSGFDWTASESAALLRYVCMPRHVLLYSTTNTV